MILRKPYAFLIKNFKKIHLLILFFVVLLTFYVNKMFRFFNVYVKDRNIDYINDLTSEYINVSLFIYIFAILVITTIIFILILKKDKPKILYVFTFVFYIFLIVLLIVNYNYLNIIQVEGLDPRVSRVLRDFNFIALLFQLFFCIMYFIRTVGFDIKKFNFGEDILELEIEVTDDEEFELTRGFNLDKFNRKYKNILREYYYFYIENKTVIKIIIGSLIIAIPSFIIIKYRIFNKIYQENEYINLNGIEYGITESYYTKYGYDNNKILSSDITFLILNLNVKNNSNINYKFKSENFSVIVNDNVYYQDKIYYEEFIDLGKIYNDDVINPGSNMNYIIIFKLEDKDLSDKYIFRYLDKIEYVEGKLKKDFYKISIKPKNLDEFEIIEENFLNTINFSTTVLKDTTINIKKMELSNTFEYESVNSTMYINEFSSNSTILKLSYNLSLDKNLVYIKNVNDLFENVVSISYTKEKKEYYPKFKIITPKAYKENDIYLSITNDIIDSENIFLNFNVRNKKYVLILR